MALSLRAEQKSILNIFKIEDQYIVPSYQRPYSWEYDQCFQLYNDILTAFKEKEDYFIGNLIIAKSNTNKGFLEVVDGQQRLITLLLFIKVLSIFQQDLIVLNKLLAKEDWKGENFLPSIKTEVFENNDNSFLTEILSFTQQDFETSLSLSIDKHGKIVERKISNKFLINVLYFYQWIKFYKEQNDNLENFITHLLQNVFLLPIELGGETQDEANEKALVIFETINNRGMNLEDADIFKAKLFNKAKKIKEDKFFIDQWTEFKSNCENLNLNIDDIFRYYSHIIRGKEGITSSEKNLREFFINENISPFQLKNYKEILDDLFRIIEIIEFITKERSEINQSTPWLQILGLYTNQYPNYAIVNYLYINGFSNNRAFVNFLKSLIRFVYFQGSTSTVKFEMYNIIKQISQNTPINEYLKEEVKSDYFDNLGRLKKGFVLLAHYLNNKTPMPYFFIDRLISLRDESYLPNWNRAEIKTILDDIGNYVVLDFPQRYLPFDRKMQSYIQSEKRDIIEFIENKFQYHDFISRSNKLKNTLITFFTRNNV